MEEFCVSFVVSVLCIAMSYELLDGMVDRFHFISLALILLLGWDVHELVLQIKVFVDVTLMYACLCIDEDKRGSVRAKKCASMISCLTPLVCRRGPSRAWDCKGRE